MLVCLLTVAFTVLYATAFLLLLQFLVDPVVARFHRTQLGLCSTGPDVAQLAVFLSQALTVVS